LHHFGKQGNNMTESIKVIYEPLGPGYYHETLLYTNSAGQQFIQSCYPTGEGGNYYSMVTAVASGVYGANTSLGKLECWSGSVTSQGAADRWGNLSTNLLAASNPVFTVATGQSLSSQWGTITQTGQAINGMNLNYSPLTLNSNSAATTSLTAASITPPGAGSPTAPGSSQNLLDPTPQPDPTNPMGDPPGGGGGGGAGDPPGGGGGGGEGDPPGGGGGGGEEDEFTVGVNQHKGGGETNSQSKDDQPVDSIVVIGKKPELESASLAMSHDALTAGRTSALVSAMASFNPGVEISHLTHHEALQSGHLLVASQQ
jgi:hypothetical protein